MRNAFTMVELVFVIVILGILAGIAIPKLAATRDDAEIAKGRSDIASIRSAIVSERQTRLILGSSNYINQLHSSGTSYFDGNGSSTLLMYGLAPRAADGHWHDANISDNTPGAFIVTYQFRVLGADNQFTYRQVDGTFDCTNDTSAPSCSLLTD